MKTIELPTGYLFTDSYSKGELETLSIGDYGKKHNVKADFLGFTKDINGVENTECMPLSEKWVITLSTQYGCIMKCNFCDVPNVKFRGNVSFSDLENQLYNAFDKFPSVNYTERLNIHFARMGEPVFNNSVFNFAEWLYEKKGDIQQEKNLRIEVIHPVLTSSMPVAFKQLEANILRWCDIKNNLYNGQAGLQLSINSTDESQRDSMFGGMQTKLIDIATIADKLPTPIGRKYCLNFAYSTDYIIDAGLFSLLFDPEKFMVKITPIHNNSACTENGIKTIDGYNSFAPYKQVEESLKFHGFDVLVFVPSMDEEDGLVTCGNVILGGSELKDLNPINISGLS